MDEITKMKFKRYAQLKQEVAERTLEADSLKADLLQAMLAVDGVDTKVTTEAGNFSVKKMKVWTYPEDIIVAEESLKKEKAVAKQTGSATFEEEYSLYFRTASV